jgi:hypothetical protein
MFAAAAAAVVVAACIFGATNYFSSNSTYSTHCNICYIVVV